MEMASGECFELNLTGARIWSLLSTGKDLSNVVATLAAEHKMAPSEIESDVRALVAELARRGLLTSQRRR